MQTLSLKPADYGPLAALIGKWYGQTGLDVAPEPDDIERNSYFETLDFEAAGPVKNAEQQHLAAIYYRQLVARNSTGQVFHDQCGYWLWNAADQSIIQTLTLPRGVSVFARGHAQIEAGSTVFSVSADENDAPPSILETAFMQHNARTVAFSHRLELRADSLSYRETTWLDIYGQKRFEHTDENRLERI